jgi:uncharacterized membrane protein
MARDELVSRLDRLETELSALQAELGEVRALLGAEAPVAELARPVVAALQDDSGPAPAASPLAGAWRALERGRTGDALDAAFEELRRARVSAEPAAVDEVEALARVASSVVAGADAQRAEQLLRRAAVIRQRLRSEAAARYVPPAPAKPAVPAPRAPQPAPSAPAPPPREWVQPGPSVGDRLAAWVRTEITGARAFAIAGGAVLLLGVIFLFVLAANRGWIGPAARVTIGALASAAVLVAGVVLRWRYGKVTAATAAVGAGIAGGYATLAAATIIYAYLPAWGALLVAAAIASVGAAVALAWSSQILAGLALVGAAVAPAAVALDDGIDWPGTAFVVVVLGATIAAASPRGWLWLQAAVTTVATVQVAWLAAEAPLDDVGAIAVGCAASLVVLAAAVAWQACGGEELDSPAASFALAAAGLGLGPTIALSGDDGTAGLILLALAAAFAIVALAVSRRTLDLAWTIGAGALLLGGVGTAFLVTGRSLTVVWAVEAAVLMVLAWKLGAQRFQFASLLYLLAAAAQSLVVEIVPDWPDAAFDVPRAAATGLVVLSAAAVACGVLQPAERRDAPSLGVAAVLDPLWAWLVRTRVELRASLAGVAAVALAAAFAAVLSGRGLTIALAALAAAAGAAAYTLGERRLSPFALGFVGFAIVHALAVEVSPDTLAAERQVHALAPVPSLAALAVAAAILSALARFDDRGIGWLGPPVGVELRLVWLRRQEVEVRRVLALVAATAVAWGVGLVAVDVSFTAGQVVATALWGVLGTTVVVLGARSRSATWQVVGFTYVVLPFFKAAGFDWEELGDGGTAASMLAVAAALFVSGFLTRWLDPGNSRPVEIVSLVAGAAATAIALGGVERVLPVDTRGLGLAALLMAGVNTVAGALPYRRWRAAGVDGWPRTLANGYWAIAVVTLLFAESVVVLGDVAGTLALWGVTGGVLVLSAKPLAEERVWLAGFAVTGVAAIGTVAQVTEPRRLVEASEHPAIDLWVLAIVAVAAWLTALTAPELARTHRSWLFGGAAGLTLYGLSLGVLELAELISGASVTTDFQRGHTVLSALWGIGALVLYVFGLSRDRRDLRVVGLSLFGLALAKLFLYDLSTLSSITRAFSFIAVGAILLAAGFFAERLVRPDHGPGPDADAAGGAET